MHGSTSPRTPSFGPNDGTNSPLIPAVSLLCSEVASGYDHSDTKIFQQTKQKAILNSEATGEYDHEKAMRLSALSCKDHGDGLIASWSQMYNSIW